MDKILKQKKVCKCIIILFIVLILLAVESHFGFAQNHEPDLKWLTLKTPHFSIHFPQGYEKTAQKIGAICEEVFKPIGSSLNYFPKRTHVVLHTRSDFANGFAAPLPWRMELYLTEPFENWIGVGEDWLKLLITHEFTHIVHLRKTKGFTKITYPLFGELNSFWQGITPHWFIEGFATLNETQYTHGGRGRNPYHFMEMNAPIQAHRPWKLEHTNFLSRKKMPLGMFYVSVYFLTNYIKNQTEANVWQKTLDTYTSFPLMGFDTALKKVTGKNQKKYYQELVHEVEAYDSTLQFSTLNLDIWSVKDKNQAVADYLVKRVPDHEYSPRWLNEKNIIFYQSSFDQLSGIVQINDEGKTKKWIERELTSQTNSFDIGQHCLIWAELKTQPRFSATVYSALKLLNLQNNRVQTITKNTRIYSLDLSPDETQLVAMQNVSPRTQLVIVNITSGKIEPLLKIKNSSVMNPRWSSNGKKVVFAVKDSTGKQNIAVLDVDLKTWRYLTSSAKFHDNYPCFAPDGNTVFFTSDRSGIYNIWAVDIETGQKAQVTNVCLGAFAPDVSPDGSQLAFNLYTYSGFVAATIPLDKKDWVLENDVKNIQRPKSLSVLYGEKSITTNYNFSDVQFRTYEPWSQILRPQGWLPMVFKYDESYSPGFFALSEDVLHRHFWQAVVGYSLESKRPFYDVFYQYSRFWPKLGVNVYNTPQKVAYKEYTGWWQKQGIFTSLSVPLILENNVRTTVLQPFVGVKYENQKQAVGILFPLYERYRGVRAGIQFFRVSQTLRDVVPHQLTSFSLSYDWALPGLKSEYKGHQVSTQLNLIFPTFFNHHQIQIVSAYQARPSTYPFGSSGAIPIGYEDNGRRQQFRFQGSYHFPIAYLEWPVLFLPIYFDYLAGSIFHDWGTDWNHGSGRDQWAVRGKSATGIQLTLSTIAFQYVPVKGSLAIFYRSLSRGISYEANISVDLVY